MGGLLQPQSATWGAQWKDPLRSAENHVKIGTNLSHEVRDITPRVGARRKSAQCPGVRDIKYAL